MTSRVGYFIAGAIVLLASTITVADSDVVRVRFMRLSFPIFVEGSGLTIKGVKSADIVPAAIPKESKIEIDVRQVNKSSFWLVRKGEILNRLSQKYVEVDSADGKITIQGYSLPAPILMTTKGEIVSALTIDNYLLGVLAGEMPASWPIEALKAQAVAARTYTLYQIKQRPKDVYHVEAGVLDQAFGTPASQTHQAKIRQAIADTQDYVLTQFGKPIKAYYHADCGGQTEDPSYVWGSGGDKNHPQSVSDVYCSVSAQSKWVVEIPLDELRERILSLHPDLGEIDDVKVVSRTPSGRASLIALGETGEQQVFLTGNDLRKAVGFMKLKSTLFDVAMKETSVVFTGRGFGHGSGLCQWGAKYLAEKGMGVKDIIKHYYPFAKLSDVPPDVTTH